MAMQTFTISNIMELMKWSLDKNPWRRLIASLDLQRVMKYHSARLVDIEIDDFLVW